MRNIGENPRPLRLRSLKTVTLEQWQRNTLWSKCSHHLHKFMGFPGGSDGKESACSVGDPSLIPKSGRSPGEDVDHPLQYAWASRVAQILKNPPAMQETWVWSLGWEDPLEGRHGDLLQYSCLQNPYGQWSLVGYSLWGGKESDMTEQLSIAQHRKIANNVPELAQQIM